MKEVIYKDGVIIDEIGNGNPVKVYKPVYTKQEFYSLIPRQLKLDIHAAKLAKNSTILLWLFTLDYMDKIDLNNLPDEFTEGLDYMASQLNETFQITQQQVDNFLER